MTRKSRVAPQSSEEVRSAKISNHNSLLAFENPELSSALTGKVIETNDNSNKNIGYSEPKPKKLRNPRKRLARSVSEVIAQKEKQERNVCSRLAYQIRRNGFCGIYMWFVDEVDLFRCRCSSCAKYLFNKLTCANTTDDELQR